MIQVDSSLTNYNSEIMLLTLNNRADREQAVSYEFSNVRILGASSDCMDCLIDRIAIGGGGGAAKGELL